MEIPSIVHKSWHPFLKPLFDDPKMSYIKEQILPSAPFYPQPATNIFRVFSMPLNSIKVVIIGQDPYFRGEAIGLSFAVKETTNIPASLQVIKAEILRNYPDRATFINSTKWRTLQHWVDQGVFLLNTALTVRVGEAGSHLNLWNWFTKQVIQIISREVTPIWLLWGARAKGYKDLIISSESFKVNTIFESAHPAAEKYGGTKDKFSGCEHFKKVNSELSLQSEPIINW